VLRIPAFQVGAANSKTRDLLQAAIDARIFPGAAAEMGSGRGPIWREALGTRTFGEDAASVDGDTVFDLASLTKPVATTTLLMELVARGRCRLDEPVSSAFPEWRGQDRERASVQDLLEHCSGLAPRLADPPPRSRREFEHEICTMPLEHALRTRALYSDLGFVLLGFLVADRGEAPLAAQFEALFARFGFDSAGGTDDLLGFNLRRDLARRAAPTRPLPDDSRSGRLLEGEVHDDYAAALGGAAGHAGLFGTAAAVGRFARIVLRAARGDPAAPEPLTPPLVARAITRSVVPGSSRALGWDTMLPTSSCGSRLSPAAFGHVGFTGTSLWIDPVADRYYVLLSNRACNGGTLAEMRRVRQAFHDSLAGADDPA
jgi:CubicO group peptidase (beta-lactamase class C family)